MKKSSLASAIALLFVMPALMLSATTVAGDSRAMWTVMVYIDADNNLEPFGISNLQMLESVGSSANVKFVVLMDTYSGPAYLRLVTKTDQKQVAWGEVDMANPATMAKFIQEAKRIAPAERYAFVSWDHGAGWRGLNWDDTTELQTGASAYMDMKELRTAIVDGGVVFDVFAFDQCLMAQPEVAYQLDGWVKYAVFSEETIYGQGFPYDVIASDLVAQPGLDGVGLSKLIVNDFAHYYNSLTWANDWTISAFDMNYMDDLTSAVKALATSSLAVIDTYRSQFKNDLVGSLNYYYHYYSDLEGYAIHVAEDKAIKDPAVTDAARKVISAIDGGIVLTVNSKHNLDSHGISIYFPSYKSSLYGYKAAYENVPFAIESGWLDFLKAFAASK